MANLALAFSAVSSLKQLALKDIVELSLLHVENHEPQKWQEALYILSVLEFICVPK